MVGVGVGLLPVERILNLASIGLTTLCLHAGSLVCIASFCSRNFNPFLLSCRRTGEEDYAELKMADVML